MKIIEKELYFKTITNEDLERRINNLKTFYIPKSNKRYKEKMDCIRDMELELNKRKGSK